MRRRSPNRDAFTLVETLAAVAVLVILFLAAARIFATVSTVAGLSEAANDVVTEAAAIERQLRRDFEQLSKEGFLAIRCVAVTNDLNTLSGGPLIDPAQPADSWVRVDQLVLFRQGMIGTHVVRQGRGLENKAQSTISRIGYGHAFQLPDAPGVETAGPGAIWAIDPVVDPAMPIVPWSRGTSELVRTRFQEDATAAPGDYVIDPNAGRVSIDQPPAFRWVLARQTIALADDGGEPSVYLGNSRSTQTISDAVIVNGRVDIATQRLSDIRRLLGSAEVVGGALVHRPMSDPTFIDAHGLPDQHSLIARQMYYPRAERKSPSMHRVDWALTNHVLATACSSITIDWTYDDGVGDAVNDAGQRFNGLQVDPRAEQPWFGLDQLGPSARRRGVRTLRSYVEGLPTANRPETIFHENIEGRPTLATSGVIEYEAYFGLNRGRPFLSGGLPDDVSGLPHADAGYTPWPSAIRITVTLHDPLPRLQHGRQVEFVIDLPQRDE